MNEEKLEELKIRRDEAKHDLNELESLIFEQLKEQTVDDEVRWRMNRVDGALSKYWYELSELICVLEDQHD